MKFVKHLSVSQGIYWIIQNRGNYEKIKKECFIYTILYAILLYTLYLILEKFNLMFRQWVNIISFIIIGSGCIIGIGQVIFSINKKWLKIVLGIIFVISLVIIGSFCLYIFYIGL